MLVRCLISPPPVRTVSFAYGSERPLLSPAARPSARSTTTQSCPGFVGRFSAATTDSASAAAESSGARVSAEATGGAEGSAEATGGADDGDAAEPAPAERHQPTRKRTLPCTSRSLLPGHSPRAIVRSTNAPSSGRPSCESVKPAWPSGTDLSMLWSFTTIVTAASPPTSSSNCSAASHSGVRLFGMWAVRFDCDAPAQSTLTFAYGSEVPDRSAPARPSAPRTTTTSCPGRDGCAWAMAIACCAAAKKRGSRAPKTARASCCTARPRRRRHTAIPRLALHAASLACAWSSSSPSSSCRCR